MSATTSGACEGAATDPRIGPSQIKAAEKAVGGRAWSAYGYAAMVRPEDRHRSIPGYTAGVAPGARALLARRATVVMRRRTR